MLSLLVNHDNTPLDEELFLVVVASPTVDMLGTIADTVWLTLIELIRIRRSRIDIMVKYAVGLKIIQ